MIKIKEFIKSNKDNILNLLLKILIAIAVGSLFVAIWIDVITGIKLIITTLICATAIVFKIITESEDKKNDRKQ